MSQAGRVLLRAKSGPRVGLGHLMRTRAVAEEVLRQGGAAQLVVDDEASADALRAAGLEAWSVLARPGWAHERAAGAWLDGFVDWSEELRALARRGTPSYLVENRTPAREFASFVVQPKLHVDLDLWERLQPEERVLRGAAWIPLRAEVRATQAAERRDLDLLVTFGGSDPLCSTERVLRSLPRGLRVAVSVGVHMQARRASIERAAEHLDGTVLPQDAVLAPWMARARLAVTALGTTLYELAYLRTPALILANYAGDRPVLDHYGEHGPHRPLGLATELDDGALAATLEHERARLCAPSVAISDLGQGAVRLAERLLARAALSLAA